MEKMAGKCGRGFLAGKTTAAAVAAKEKEKMRFAVICLDGDGCKIRTGSLIIEEDSNLDTSIACDSCDV
ncbi:unnamed protein product [Camellia sinensis]